MPRYTPAYSRLMTRFNEVDAILAMARRAGLEAARTLNATRVNALCRSGVVLIESHIEGFVEDLGAVALQQIVTSTLPKNRLAPDFGYYISQDIIRRIKDTKEPIGIANHVRSLWQRDNHIWGSGLNYDQPISSTVFNRSFDRPTHEEISKFFGRFGYQRYSSDLDRFLTRDAIVCKNMIDQVNIQRNQIAHGDAIVTSTPTDLQNMMGLVRLYCRAMDVIVADWFRGMGCVLRRV